MAECDALARGEGALDLALGETLLRLFKGDRLLELGFSRQVDYARERLGVAARTMFLWLRLARELARKPLLRRAVETGLVSTSKALTVAGAASGPAEAQWTAAAAALPLGELKRRVRESGHDPEFDTFEIESWALTMTDDERSRLDVAWTVAELVVGPGTPRWQRLEAMCMEWLGAHAGSCDAACDRSSDRALDVRPGLERLLSRFPLPADGCPEGAVELDARARELVRRRVGRDERLGRLLTRIHEEESYRALGFAWFSSYCRERLGMAPRTVRERLWLERRLSSLPALREAFASGELPRTKVMLLARDASPADVDELLARARETTWQQLDREQTEAQERRDRAAGVCRVWGPREAVETIGTALRAAREFLMRRDRTEATEGAALAEIADHFVVVWAPQLVRWRGSKARKEVFFRHRGVCGVPGCGRPAQHAHHVVSRSRGGSHDRANLVALCAAHHLRGVHRGRITVTGEAGRRLRWVVTATGEIWETRGEDDVRRVTHRAPGRADRGTAFAAGTSRSRSPRLAPCATPSPS